VKFYKYRFPILFFRGVFKATLITLCFTLQMILKLINLILLLARAYARG